MKLGYRKYLVIVLVFISFLLIGRLKKYLEKISENNQERTRMITKMKRSWKRILWYSGKIAFIFSISIEMLQLLLRLGTFQLSDLFYNTVGGVLGGLMYYTVMKVRRHL